MDKVSTIPDLTSCLSLMDEYGMFVNIRHHCLVVALISAQLWDGLAAMQGTERLPDKKELIMGALLHDIAKTPCLGQECNHALMGAEICREHGFEEIAPIVAEHVRLSDFNLGRYQKGQFLAKELVYYADKRVLHHLVVSLGMRLEYILDRYGQNNPARCALIKENFQQCEFFEKELFSWLPFSPEQLSLP